MTARHDQPTPDDLFHAEHRNCDAPWRCGGCELLVCPRCEPSPAEEELCATCWWTQDPEGPDAA